MGAIFPAVKEIALKEQFLGAAAGYFVEVGANDPVEGSQTWHLEQLGWTGILVEPQPMLAQELRRRRRAKVFAVACSSRGRDRTAASLYLAGIFSSLDRDFFAAGQQRQGVIEVPLRSLDEVLIEAGAPCPIDFLAIDVEGREIDVLSGFTIEKWRPRLLIIEDIALDMSRHKYLQTHGYKWIRRTGINAWYVPKESADHADLYGKLQFIRKYYLGRPFRHFREWNRRRRSSQGTSLSLPRREARFSP
jgi:FkbM family methyltransferase